MKTVKTTLAAFVLTSMVTGCANMEDTSRTQTEGAGMGALLGAAIGYAVGGDGKSAAIGAALGGGLGYVVGNEVAKRKRAYATTEEFLNGEIARTHEFNNTAVAYNQKLRKDIAALNQETRTLRANYDKGRASKDSLVAKRASLKKQLEDNRKLENTLAKEYDVQKAVLAEEGKSRPAGDAYISRLEKEVKALQGNLEQLREGSSQLASIDQRLSV